MDKPMSLSALTGHPTVALRGSAQVLPAQRTLDVTGQGAVGKGGELLG